MDHKRLSAAIVALVKLVARLRGPQGCPWDAKQTDNSIAEFLLEECYEVLEALEDSSPQEVCSELGDLLFQVVFLAHLAMERKDYDLVDIIENITEKMIRRHPHVFGDEGIKDAEEVARNWTKIKEIENGTEDIAFHLKRVPNALPALQRAHRLNERASKINFLNISDKAGLWKEIHAQYNDLERLTRQEDDKKFGDLMGELLFNLANYTRLRGLNAERLLRTTNRRFVQRIEKKEHTGR